MKDVTWVENEGLFFFFFFPLYFKLSGLDLLVEVCNYKLTTGLHIPPVCGLLCVCVCPPDTEQ